MALGSSTRRDTLRIVVLGYIVRCPIGGMAWHHLQYVLGLAQLGHDVYFIEDSGDEQWACYDPARSVTDPDPGYGLKFIEQIFQQVGLDHRWAYHDALGTRWYGPAANRIDELSRTADLVLNLSGSNLLRDWVMRIPVRVYVDTDPVFTQLRHLSNSSRLDRALQHTTFFSFGENIGQASCNIPDDGIAWQATRQPVVLDAWPVTPGPAAGSFTTVMQWDKTLQDVPLEHNGQRYGRKADSFTAYYDLPKRSGERLELALGGSAAPRHELAANGWGIRDPLAVTRDPWTYQQYIQESKGEFSVAKQGYVVARSGWFSERTACYLASGRPTLVEDTGFSNWLPCGMGVIAFSNPDEAIQGLDEINSNYMTHCSAARDTAEQYFDAGRVLTELIDCIMHA